MLTLQELKQVVGNREERRKVPSARYLRENDVAVVKQRLIDGAEIIAYQTGYVFYCVGDYGTVFPLFTCRDYVYEAGRKITVVKEDFFDNQPWYVRLILEGEDRLCRNREVREHNNCISYSHISEAEIPSGIPKEEIRQGGKAICRNYRTSGIWHRNMLYQ